MYFWGLNKNKLSELKEAIKDIVTNLERRKQVFLDDTIT